MKKNRKGIRYMSMSAALILLLVWGAGVYWVNAKIPQVKQSVFPNREWVAWKDGAEINVSGTRFMEDKEIRGEGKIPEGQLFPYEMRLLWVEIGIRNTNDQEVSLDMLDLGAESAGWSNIPDIDYYQALVGSEKTLRVNLKPGDEVTYELPYLLLKANFTESEWKKAEQKKYYITWKLYPEKKSVTLSGLRTNEE